MLRRMIVALPPGTPPDGKEHSWSELAGWEQIGILVLAGVFLVFVLMMTWAFWHRARRLRRQDANSPETNPGGTDGRP